MKSEKSTAYGWGFDVICRGCDRIITVQEQKDLKEKICPKRNRPIYGVVCQICGQEMWFDGIIGRTLGDEIQKSTEK